MYCKYCGKEMADDARFCPGCGKPLSAEFYTEETNDVRNSKKKKKRHPILATFVLIFGIVMIVGAFSSDDEPKRVESAVTQDVITETTEEPNFSVGDTLEMGGILVTLEDVSESAGAQFLAPSDGNVFVICELTIKNESNSELAISSMMSFECYFDDYAANISIGAMASDNNAQSLDGSVSPGKIIRGIVAYEAPENWSNMEIHFKPNLYTTNPFIFNYSK